MVLVTIVPTPAKIYLKLLSQNLLKSYSPKKTIFDNFEVRSDLEI